MSNTINNTIQSTFIEDKIYLDEIYHEKDQERKEYVQSLKYWFKALNNDVSIRNEPNIREALGFCKFYLSLIEELN